MKLLIKVSIVVLVGLIESLEATHVTKDIGM